jgi:hypothetical protein
VIQARFSCCRLHTDFLLAFIFVSEDEDHITPKRLLNFKRILALIPPKHKSSTLNFTAYGKVNSHTAFIVVLYSELHYATSQKVAGSIPDEVDFFN